MYAFFLESLEPAAARVRALIEKGAQASGGEVADDAATGQGLLAYVLRAVDCGAVTEREAESLTGLSAAEIRSGIVCVGCGRAAEVVPSHSDGDGDASFCANATVSS